MEKQLTHHKTLDDAKRKELYRDTVQRRNLEAIEEKKFKTLARLEGLDIRSPGQASGKAYFSGGSASNGRRASP